VDLERVDRITTDAIGEPGSRTFYLQARRAGDVVTVILEKEQVRLLSASILELLQRVGRETEARGVPDEALSLEEPVSPPWRAGRLMLSYEEDQDLLMLEVEELVPEEEGERDAGELHLSATREQMLALAHHGAAAVAAGRPTCPFCGNPMDPEGHWCPATNGHREFGSV
jgi:uncharacterized repeat protein (TIGR03847 family)